MTEDQNLTLQTTRDGSPTLSLINGESMHNRQGASSEALYLYQPAMAYIHEKKLPKSVLSVGLGLGYNEMIFAMEALLGSWKTFYLESFEKQESLQKSFLAWLQKPSPDNHDTQDNYDTDNYDIDIYDRVWSSLAARYHERNSNHEKNSNHERNSNHSQHIKDLLLESLQNGKWQMRGTLNKETTFEHPFSCILFDAYSSRTSPEMWTQEALSHWISQAAAPHCIFSTYAATGALSRSLKQQGFTAQTRPGFGGKRESTWGLRICPSSGGADNITYVTNTHLPL